MVAHDRGFKPPAPALAAVELVFKYFVRLRLPKEPGLAAAATTITEQIRELGFDAEAERIAADMLRGNGLMRGAHT